MSRASVLAFARRRAAPAVLAGAMFLAVGTYGAFTTPVDHDEDLYVWAGAYLVHQIATADTSAQSHGQYADPHWDPLTPWALGMGTGTRLVYGLGLALTPDTHAPPRPWAIDFPDDESTFAAERTVRVLRMLAVLCACAGIALIALRFRWAALAGGAVILLLPEGIATFSRAWAEGPLLLGFGLVAVAWGTRWFASLLGVALTFKLTALGLWPLVLWKRARVLPLWKALIAMLGTYMVLTPASWFFGGPIFLFKLVEFRGQHYSDQSAEGAFLPARYFWPFELALVLFSFAVVERLLASRAARQTIPDDEVAQPLGR